MGQFQEVIIFNH